MPYGERLKAYRGLRKMSQEELAHQAGILPTAISKIEHGTRKVTLEEAVRLAEVLHVTLAELAGIEEPSRQVPEDPRLEAFKELCRLYPREQLAEVGGAVAKITEVLSQYSQLKFMDEYQYALA